ncbi:MAG: M1 family aminopeptidase [Bacteroidales bacterium]|jgi:aminopeptidase N
MKNIFTVILLVISIASPAQKPDASKNDAWKNIYRATPTKINDLVNTRLEVRFDFTRSWMPGKEWITLHPHFYPTDSLNLDAHYMAINEVSVVKDGKHIPLKYTYDSLNLRITLDRSYKSWENYTIYIDYIAMPEHIKIPGGFAVTDSKGLYFINPLGKIRDKPTEVWTQGETECNSGWFPTIDKPDQKTTDEISITVPSRFVTLSNGLMVKQKNNSDGTRTDTWKMDLPHAPYLLMMAVGEYSIVKDKYKNKEVNYYVEKEYEPVARRIFGLTPEMITFFSNILGVDFPWPKYSQVAVRDYVSGAMENTTATVHGESVQQDARQLIDENGWENTIAHELFHSWFGDYVTTESWSNITINESFATYGAIAWAGYKHGKDGFGEELFNSLQQYLFSNSSTKDLVRFYWRNPDDMFDGVSYQKGSCILNMLRTYVGDSAFYRSLNRFLTTYKFQAVEAQQLRLAFEDVTGMDLNWFWNQWYYGSGHPKLDISYDYDAAAKTARVFVKQNQKDKLFRLPVAIDVYNGTDKKRYNVWVEHQADTFTFKCESKPDLINFDGEKMLLCEKSDHKSTVNYIFQYNNAGLYLDRREAIDYAANKQKDDPGARAILKSAMNDRFDNLRVYTIQRLNASNDSVRAFAEPKLAVMAASDPSSLVRASAIDFLGRLKKPVYRDLFLKATTDSSYSIAGSGLTALVEIDSTAALSRAKELSAQKTKGRLTRAVNSVLYEFAGENDFQSLADQFARLPFGQNKFSVLVPFSGYLKKIKNDENFRKGIDLLISFRDSIPAQYSQQILPYINGVILNGIASAKQSANMTAQAEYVKSRLAGNNKSQTEAVQVPTEVLQKYEGEYIYENETFKVVLKNSKTLFLTIPGQPDIELVPLTKTSFSFKFMDDYKIEFVINDKGEITSFTYSGPGQDFKADRKK